LYNRGVAIRLKLEIAALNMS